jgi:hypothetical protein
VVPITKLAILECPLYPRTTRSAPTSSTKRTMASAPWPMRISCTTFAPCSPAIRAASWPTVSKTGLNRTDLGKLILTAWLICDIGTVGALGIVFANYNSLLIASGIASVLALLVLPRSLRLVIRVLGHAMSEPEVKCVFLLLFGLGALATAAAYLLGLVAAGRFHEDPRLAGRIPGIAFSFLTPFFFLKAGTLIVRKAVITGVGSIAVLFGVKVGAKTVGVYPATIAYRVPRREVLVHDIAQSVFRPRITELLHGREPHTVASSSAPAGERATDVPRAGELDVSR